MDIVTAADLAAIARARDEFARLVEEHDAELSDDAVASCILPMVFRSPSFTAIVPGANQFVDWVVTAVERPGGARFRVLDWRIALDRLRALIAGHTRSADTADGIATPMERTPSAPPTQQER